MTNVITLIPTELDEVTIGSLPLGTMFSYLRSDGVYMKIEPRDDTLFSIVNLATGMGYKADGTARVEVRKAVTISEKRG